MKIVIVHIITGTAMMTASRVRFTDGRAQQRRAVVALGHRVSDYVGNVRDRGGACHRLAVIRSMRDGEHCKHDRRSDKPQACHHHDRDERVSGEAPAINRLQRCGTCQTARRTMATAA
jgi:hypothetical protein